MCSCCFLNVLYQLLFPSPHRLKGCVFESLQEQWRFCWLLFRYPFHPRVTAVARKRSWSFCQKCRWQVTAKPAYNLRMWLCMKWHGAWLYGVHRTCAEMAAVSCDTSLGHVCLLHWLKVSTTWTCVPTTLTKSKHHLDMCAYYTD